MKKIVFICMLIGLISGQMSGESVYMKDGSIIKGTIVSQTENEVIVESSLGRMRLPKNQLLRIEYGTQTTSYNDIQDQTNPNHSIKIQQIENLIENGKFRSKSQIKQIQKISTQLPGDYNQLLYKNYEKKNPLLYATLNLIPGLGSLVQGDYWGTVLIGLGFLGTYYIYENLVYSYTTQPYYDSFYGYTSYTYNYSINQNWQYIALGLFTSTVIYSLVRPFIYRNRYNEQLHKALFSDFSVSRGDSHQIYKVNEILRIPVLSYSF